MAFNLADVLKNVPEVGTGRDRIEYIRMDQIREDPNNFYKLSGIEELAANIQLCGLQQPIRVRCVPDEPEQYVIVSGHRRRKAVELLAQEDAQRWTEIPCIVEQDDVSPNLQQLRLIYANANTRTMTSAEVSEQAVQVEKLLYQLKEEGYEFPGRMRDHVAQAVNASKSKLSRLKVIRDGLADCWQKAWKEGKLGESSAYALARIDKAWQRLIFANCSNVNMLYEGTVQEYAKRFEAISQMACGEGKDMVCGHKAVMMEKSCRDRWSDPCRSRCCVTCGSLRTCKSSCARSAAEKAKQKEAFKADADETARKVAERDKPIIDTVRGVYDRVGKARATAGVSVRELFEAQGKHFNEKYDNEDYLKAEGGEAKLRVNTPLPFGYGMYASNVKALIQVADLLNVSIDYLLGREESETKLPESGAGWRTGDPEAYGTYAAYVRVADVDRLLLKELLWDGEEWFLHGEPIHQDVAVAYWAERPEV